MPLKIHRLRLPLIRFITYVNCYLLQNEAGFFLVDSGFTTSHRELERQLLQYGCQPGELRLILLTHGDFDHTGSAVYIRGKFGGKIAMHRSDVGMLERGDMFWERKMEHRFTKRLMEALMPFGATNRGTPDLLVEDNQSLADYGWQATVLNTPGHSQGSICVLTQDGELFAGDLLTNSYAAPRLNTMLYDAPAGHASLERLKSMPIRMVYPGHGLPFEWGELLAGLK